MKNALEGNRGQENKRLLFFLGVILFIILALFGLPRLAIPLGVAYVWNLILSPLIPILRKFRIGKVWSIIVIFLGLGFFMVYPIVRMAPHIQNEVDNIQYYMPKVQDYLKDVFSKSRRVVYERTGYELPEKYFNDGMTYIANSSQGLLAGLPNFLAYLLEWAFVIPLFLFFFMRDGRKFLRSFIQIAPNALFERLYYLLSQFNKQIGDYIFAKFIEASIVGAIIATGLWILDVRFALILGLVAAVTNIIPYLGPLLGMVPAVILGLAEYGQGTTLGAIVVLYLIANAVDLSLVFPILVSKIVDLHPLIVVASVILGSQYFGVVGMIVSVPVAASLKLVIKEVHQSLYASDN